MDDEDDEDAADAEDADVSRDACRLERCIRQHHPGPTGITYLYYGNCGIVELWNCGIVVLWYCGIVVLWYYSMVAGEEGSSLQTIN
jgi:hypothetical protein